MELGLSGRVVVVTGGGHGIGRASALRFASEGAIVAIIDVRPDSAVQVAELIQSRGGAAQGWTADMTSVDAVADTISDIKTAYGPIDVLHSNAGILRAGTAITQEVWDWDETFAVNVRGMFLAAKAVLPDMMERGRGVIVNTASTSGLVGDPNSVAYNASKGAVVNLTRQMAVDFARRGIRVNCVCPGWVDTGFNDPVLKDFSANEVETMIQAAVPLGRQGLVDEMAAAVVFLASDQASYICGHALVVDGGLTAQ